MPDELMTERRVLSLQRGDMMFHRVGKGGQTLLLLHGLGDNGLCWSRVVRALVDDYTIVMLDSRGHGGSTLPPPDVLDDPAIDLAEVLDQLGLEQALVVGHSVGAISAARFAAAHPEKVRKLVLEDPPFRSRAQAPSDEMVAAFTKQVNRYRAMTLAEVIKEGQKQHSTWHAAEFDAWAEGKLQFDPRILGQYHFPAWRDVVSEVQAPTLLVHGMPGSDTAVSMERAREIVALNPAFRSVAIAGAGHNVRRENLEGYLSSLRSFLS
jgi:pimeloyl-ACP methyl ester carboxylesterase